MAMPVLARIEKINAPMAHMPIVTPISVSVGKYSTIFPHGPGINPGTISPKPFSIQIPINKRIQAKYKIFKLFRNL